MLYCHVPLHVSKDTYDSTLVLEYSLEENTSCFHIEYSLIESWLYDINTRAVVRPSFSKYIRCEYALVRSSFAKAIWYEYACRAPLFVCERYMIWVNVWWSALGMRKIYDMNTHVVVRFSFAKDIWYYACGGPLFVCEEEYACGGRLFVCEKCMMSIRVRWSALRLRNIYDMNTHALVRSSFAKATVYDMYTRVVVRFTFTKDVWYEYACGLQ